MRNRSYLLFLAGALLLMGSLAYAQAVKITKGPVIEHAGATNAVIAWSTNVPAATVVKYGTDPHNLDQRAEMPWGGLTHRVTLKNLNPGTTYYYQADSSQGQGTGTDATSAPEQFRTQGENASASAPGQPKPELKITHGPVLEHVGDTNATIAWSTDLPSSSIVRYGSDPNHLTRTAEVPWGATTHRVQLKNLKPGTQYFFSVHSAQGKNAPGQAQDTPPQPFTTAAQGQQAKK